MTGQRWLLWFGIAAAICGICSPKSASATLFGMRFETKVVHAGLRHLADGIVPGAGTVANGSAALEIVAAAAVQGHVQAPVEEIVRVQDGHMHVGRIDGHLDVPVRQHEALLEEHAAADPRAGADLQHLQVTPSGGGLGDGGAPAGVSLGGALPGPSDPPSTYLEPRGPRVVPLTP